MSRRDLVERWFKDIWEDRNYTALRELLAPSTATNDLIEGMEAPHREFPLLVDVVHHLVGPMRVEIQQFLEDGDWSTARYVMRSDGGDGVTPICAEGIIMMRFEDAQIAEVSSQFDCFTLFEQLGQLPQEALVACLSGQKLTWA